MLALAFFYYIFVILMPKPAVGKAVVQLQADTVTGTPGETVSVEVRGTLRTGWHINAHRPGVDYLIPTEIKGFDTAVETVGIDYPPGDTYQFISAAKPVKIYKKMFAINLVINLPSSIKDEFHHLEGKLGYQPCLDEQCEPPRTENFTVPLIIKKSGQKYTPGSKSKYYYWLSEGLMGELSEGISLLTLATLLLLGLVMNLTPCVYPLIPVTIAFFGGKKSRGRRIRFLDGLLFYLGLVIFYSILGTVAGYTGELMSGIFQNSAVQVSLSALMVVLAGSCFDLYHFRIPGVQKFISGRKAGRVSSFLMGLTLGLAATPCVGPVVAGLLAFVGQQGGLVSGFIYFLVFSLGFGMPYFLLSIFTPLLDLLPGSGGWLAWVEKVLGFLLIGLAIFFSAGLLPEMMLRIIVYSWVLTGLIVLSIVHSPENKILFGLRIALLILGAAGVILGINWWYLRTSSIEWQKARKFLARKEQISKPVFFYVTADWCLPCRQLEAQTFSSEKIHKFNSEINFVKADVTTSPSGPVTQWLKKNNIKGVPTMLFMDCETQILDNGRVTGYITPQQLEQRLKHTADSC